MVICSNLQKAESILNSDQVAQGFVKQDLKNLKDRDSTALLGSLSQYLIILTVNGYFSLRLSLFCLDLRTRCLIFWPSASVKSPALFDCLLIFMEGCHQVTLPMKHLLQAEQAPFPHLCKGCTLQFPTVLVTLHWIYSSHSMSVLSWAGRKRGGGVEILKQYSRWVLTSADKKGNGTLPSLFCLTQSSTLSAFTAARGHCKTPHLSTEL